MPPVKAYMKRGSKQQTLSYPPARPTTRIHSVNDTLRGTNHGERGLLLDEYGGLGRKFDIIPEARNYKYEDVFYGEFGENALLNPHNNGLKQHSPFEEALFVKVDKLEQSKKQAAASFAALSAASESKHENHADLISAATHDQHTVLRDRIHVLNDLIKHPSSHVCISHKILEKTPRALAAVTYSRYVRASTDSVMEMGEIQSPMAWFVPGAQTHVANILTSLSPSSGDLSADHPSVAKSLKGLLTGVLKSLPYQYATKKLRKSLRATYPTTLHDETDLGIPSTHGARHAQPPALTSHHIRVLSAETEIKESTNKKTGKKKEAEKVTAYLISGAMDLNVLELWQNPSTNMLVRKSIIQTSLHHMPRGQLTNVHTLHIKILRGWETHVLTFRPFIGTEACTVSHLLYNQPLAGGAGDHEAQKGMLRLPDDPSKVDAMHGGRILPLTSYVCLGAHRESRYNEAQLNYIHSRAFVKSADSGTNKGETSGLAIDPQKLPEADKIQWTSSLPLAKATRISGKDCDVMASSYAIDEEVLTAITVINYPPFGTQFKIKRRREKKVIDPSLPKHLRPAGNHPPGTKENADQHKGGATFSSESDSTMIPRPSSLHQNARKVLQEQQLKLHKDLQSMQTHIQSLESKLTRTRRDANTEHLMHEVLRRLQARG